MKVLYVDQYFSTRQGISGTRTHEFARRLVALGHEVTVVTTATRYAGDDLPRGPWPMVTTVDGVRVIALAIDYSSRMGYARRALAFAAFMVLGTIVGLVLPRQDVVVATSTPLSVGVPGFLIAFLRGGRFVFEVRDLWPEAPIQLGVLRHPVLIALLRGLEGFLYRGARKVIALSPGMKDGVVGRGIDPMKVAMIPNACDLDLIAGARPATDRLAELGLAGKEIVLYAGAMGPANGLDYLLDLAAATKQAGADAVHYLAIGDGPDRARLVAAAAARGLLNVTFVDPVPRARIAGYLLSARATLTLFADRPILATNSPNKWFDALAAGRPALVNSDGWTRAAVDEAGAGFFLDPRDPEDAARRIVELVSDPARVAAMGRAARRLAEERFSREKLAADLERTLAEVRDASPVLGGPGTAIKRLVDIVGAALVLALLAPLFAAIARAIRRDSPGPAIYRQERPGRGGRPFTVRKFRTMVVGAERTGLGLNVEAGDPRITRVGRFLRAWSLDELPQLWNVLFGEMSLVGPRPALFEQAAKYDATARRRLLVRPGLTGWAQVTGRNALTWSERIARDVWYVDHLSLALDLRILARTLGVVLRREGLYEPEGGAGDAFNRFDDGDGRPDVHDR